MLRSLVGSEMCIRDRCWDLFEERISQFGNDEVEEEGFVQYYMRYGLTAADLEAREARLQVVWDMVDVNHDGGITRTEVIKALRKHPEVREVFGLDVFSQNTQGHNEFESKFQNLDTDNSRNVTWDEFMALAEDLEAARPEKHMSGSSAWFHKPGPNSATLQPKKPPSRRVSTVQDDGGSSPNSGSREEEMSDIPLRDLKSAELDKHGALNRDRSPEALREDATVHIRLGQTLEKRNEFCPEALAEYGAGIDLLEQALEEPMPERLQREVQEDLDKARALAKSLQSLAVNDSIYKTRDVGDEQVFGHAEFNLIDPDAETNPEIVDHCIKAVAPAAEAIGHFFGFQQDSIRNQSEHLIMLLIARMSTETVDLDAATAHVYTHLLKNQMRWSEYVEVAAPSFGDDCQSQLWCLMLWLLIWGEAANIRHMPECLAWLYHKMMEEATDAGIATSVRARRVRQEDHFLNCVVKPLYLCVVQGSKNAEKNYDDCNEVFWSKQALAYGHDNTNTTIEHISAALTQGELSTKTFVEKRTMISGYVAFWRIYKFHAMLGCALAVRAYYARSDRVADWRVGDLLWRTCCTAVAFDLIQAVMMMFSGAIRLGHCSSYLYLPRLFLCSIMAVFMSVLSATNHEVANAAITSELSGGELFMFVSVVMFEWVQCLWEAIEMTLPMVVTKVRRIVNRNESSATLAAVLFPHTQLSYLGNETLQASFIESLKSVLFWTGLFWCKSVFVFSFLVLDVMDATVELLDSEPFPIVKAYPNWWGGVGGEYPTIIVAWTPLTLMWFLDTQIWFQVFVASFGCITGYIARIGEIRNFNHMVQMFHELPRYATAAFGVGCRFSGQSAEMQMQGAEKLGFIDRASWRPSPSMDHGQYAPLETSDDKPPETNLRESTHNQIVCDDDEGGNVWAVMGPIWNMSVDRMRKRDLLSNLELKYLRFRPRPPPSVTPGLPLFLLAGEVTRAIDYALGYAQVDQVIGEYESREIIWARHVKKWRYMLEALHEVSDIVFALCSSLLGYKHEETVARLREWVVDMTVESLNCMKVTNLQPLADALLLFAEKMVDKSQRFLLLKPSVLAEAGLMLDDRDLNEDAKPAWVVDKDTGDRHKMYQHEENEFITLKNEIMASLRLVLLRCQEVVSDIPDISQLFHELMYTADGWFWVDEYCKPQTALVLADPVLMTYAESLTLLLRTAKLDTVPKNSVAQDQLSFFANSLLMNIPSPPPVGAMRSWSVLTPFYSEDVTYSDHELDELTEDEVSKMFYLRMILPDEWDNFLERIGVEDEEELIKTETGRHKRRKWASFRGQTLHRTIRGMMCGEEAVKALAQFCDNATLAEAEQLAQLKFTYVVSCQIYGQQTKAKDPKVHQINNLMKQYRNLRVAYIDEVRTGNNYGYFSVLVKARVDKEGVDRIVEVYRVKLPGVPMVGFGKPENQNHAMIFTRGEYLQTIDMNQDWSFHECLKVRNLLQEFSEDHATDGLGAPAIAGFRENIFTLNMTSMGSFMALQDTTFVTINQRMLYSLDVRMHYGHPDVFDKFFTMSSGGVSKASKPTNLSEDIFSGFNATMRGERVTYSDYIAVGKGRDTALSQIFKFEAKVAQGNAEQALSRDYYRLGNSLSLTRLMSLYFGHVGYYFGITGMLVTIYIFLYLNTLLAMIVVDPCSSDDPKLSQSSCGALVQVLNAIWLLQIGIANTLPLLCTRGLQKGWKFAIWEFIKMHFEGGPVFFLFGIQTKAHYFLQTLLYGGARYRATGRGFMLHHEPFDDLYRFYYASHFRPMMEMLFVTILWITHVDWGFRGSFLLSSWTLWLLILAWMFAPFFFNPLGYEWGKTKVDISRWWAWMRRYSLSSDTSWSVWWKEETSTRCHASGWVRFGGTFLACRHVCIAVGACLQVKNDAWGIPRWPLVLLTWGAIMFIWWAYLWTDRFLQKHATLRALRGIQAVIFFMIIPTVLALLWILPGQDQLSNPDILRLIFAAIACHAATCEIITESGHPATRRSKFVRFSCQAYHYLTGIVLLTPVVVLSLIPYVHELQTFIMFNAAYGANIEVAALLQGRRKLNQPEQDID
eukprot:TRINITY_DN8943_c0_g1_i8.p1 TRINITY_DN8943_c0_g1~~TRINITY_DN8943_c0_g1_i8.p1  ORF type:complete len:2058 (+),score=512.22 TRINITY_DN8943_c0_g1_i8:149-6322(+)